MALRNIAMESRPIIDTQYAIYAAYEAANDAAHNRPHGTCIVVTDASAMGSAIRYALSMCSGRHGERHGADECDLSKHVYLYFDGNCTLTLQNDVGSIHYQMLCIFHSGE